MIEGHHEVQKSLSLAPLEEMRKRHLLFLESKAPSALKVKMGHGGQEGPARKSEITLDKKKGSIVSCGPISHPIAWSKYPISKVLPVLYFLDFVWVETPF